MGAVISIIDITVALLTLLVFIYSLLSLFMSPYHPIRRTVGQIVEPMLAPIRKLLPSTGGLDFSPLILIIILQVLGSILAAVLRIF